MAINNILRHSHHNTLEIIKSMENKAYLVETAWQTRDCFWSCSKLWLIHCHGPSAGPNSFQRHSEHNTCGMVSRMVNRQAMGHNESQWHFPFCVYFRKTDVDKIRIEELNGALTSLLPHLQPVGQKMTLFIWTVLSADLKRQFSVRLFVVLIVCIAELPDSSVE